MRNFEKIFSKLTYSHDVSRVWEDFLDYSIDQFLLNGLSEKHFQYKKYSKKEQKYFGELFECWIKTTHEKLETVSWYDFLGTFYEEIVLGKFKAGNLGQFFTPAHICTLMSDLLPKENTGVCNDPCCGSGRLLLAHHVNNLEDICFGEDLDNVACRMAVLNFVIHGVKGSICHKNTITGEWFKSWKVNEFLYHGLPIPHVEVVSYEHSQTFFGMNLDKKIEDNNVEINESVVFTEKETVQTTLI